LKTKKKGETGQREEPFIHSGGEGRPSKFSQEEERGLGAVGGEIDHRRRRWRWRKSVHLPEKLLPHRLKRRRSP